MSTADRSADPNVSSDHNAASVRSTISRQKLAANRRNAKRSTGSRTEQGKRVASRNASTHNIFTRELILRGESRREFIQLWNSIQITVHADNGVEFALLNRFVAAQWRLLRVQAAEAALHEESIERVDRVAQRKIQRLRDKEEDLGRFAEPEELEEIHEKLGRMRMLVELTAIGQTPAGPILAADMYGGPNGATEGPRTRLSRYEQRIEASGMRALTMLFKIREQMSKHPAKSQGPCPFLIDESEADDDAKLEATLERLQNEPTEDEPAASDEAAEGCDAPSRGTGASPVQRKQDDSTGEAPVPRDTEETRAEATREPSD